MAKANTSEVFRQNGKDLELVNKNELALMVKQYRMLKNMTQKELGDMCNVSRYTIMRVENAQDITWMSAYKVFAKIIGEVSGLKYNEMPS